MLTFIFTRGHCKNHTITRGCTITDYLLSKYNLETVYVGVGFWIDLYIYIIYIKY